MTVTAASSNTALIPTPGINYTSPDTTGLLTYTPVANTSGQATITVTVMDSGGVLNGGVASITQSFLIVVTPVNQMGCASIEQQTNDCRVATSRRDDRDPISTIGHPIDVATFSNSLIEQDDQNGPVIQRKGVDNPSSGSSRE